MDRPMTFHEKLCPRALLQRAAAALALDPVPSSPALPAIPPPRPEPDLAELLASGRMWG